MKELSTLHVSRRGQAVLPMEWRKECGLAGGGPCDLRPVHDGLGSLLITPRPRRRMGAKGLAKFLAGQSAAFPPVERHTLPSK